MSARVAFRGGVDFDAGPETARYKVWDHARQAYLQRAGEAGESAVYATREEALESLRRAGLTLSWERVFKGGWVEVAEPSDWRDRGAASARQRRRL